MSSSERAHTVLWRESGLLALGQHLAHDANDVHVYGDNRTDDESALRNRKESLL